MPPLEETDLPHRAVLWAFSGRYSGNGLPRQLPPVEIYCRWNEAPREMLDSKGNKISLEATAVVKRRIDVGSVMWRGRLEEWLGTGSGLFDAAVLEVKAYSETADLKARSKMRTVGLMKFKSKPNV